MAAGKDEPQAVIGDQALLSHRRMLLGVHARELCQPVSAIGERASAAQPVDCSPSCSGRDPSARIRRDAVARPRRDRRGERILDRVLGKLEVADLPDECRQDPGTLLPEGPVDGERRVARTGAPRADRVHRAGTASSPTLAGAPMSITGRTSTEP
jgi:hypothetical protein